MANDFANLETKLKGTNKFANLTFKDLGNKVKLGKWTIGKQFVDKILEGSPYSSDWVSAFQTAQQKNPNLAPDYDYYQSFQPYKKVAKKLGFDAIDTVAELSDIFSFAKTIGSKLYPNKVSPAELSTTQGYTGLQTTSTPAEGSPGTIEQAIEPKALDVSTLTSTEGDALGQVKPVEGPTIEELTNQLKVLQEKIDKPTVEPLAKSFTETLKPAKFEQKAQSPYQIKLMSGLGQYFGQQGLRIQSLLNK